MLDAKFIKALEKAATNPENIDENNEVIWNYVDKMSTNKSRTTCNKNFQIISLLKTNGLLKFLKSCNCKSLSER